MLAYPHPHLLGSLLLAYPALIPGLESQPDSGHPKQMKDAPSPVSIAMVPMSLSQTHPPASGKLGDIL